jgi:hypothetical protein
MNDLFSKLLLQITSVVSSLALCFGCSSTKDISKEPPYSQCIGKKFILKEDMYIFKFNDSYKYAIAGPDSGISGLTKFVDPKFIGRDSGRLVIKGIIKKGSIFHIIRVNCVTTFELSYIDFLITFENIPISKNGVLSGSILNLNNPPDTKTWSDPPIFKANLVEPLPSDGIWWK